MTDSETLERSGRPRAPGEPQLAAGLAGAGAADAPTQLPRPSRSWLPFLEAYALLGCLLVVGVFFSVFPETSDTFLTTANIRVLIAGQAVVAVVALAILIPLCANEWDLSVGAIAGLSAVIGASVMSSGGLLLGILAGAGIGLLVGLANALIVTRFNVHAVIATLGMATILAGVINQKTGGLSVVSDIPESLTSLGSETWLGLPRIAFVVVVVALAAHYVLEYTPYGRYLYALGGNPTAARLVGLRTRTVLAAAFVIAGLLAAMGGILAVARAGGADPQLGDQLLLPAFAAAFLSAASIKPGRYNVGGLLVAVYFLAVLNNGLNLAGVKPFVNLYVNGAALIIGVGVAANLGRRRRGSARSGTLSGEPVKALRLIAWQAEPELRDVPVPDPAPGEVLLEVLAAGLCHSDLHLMEWPEGTLPYELPFTLGHETVGRVAALGVGARGVDVGETVLVYGPWGCDRCWHCATGAVNLCERAAQARGHGSGMGYDGGLAEYVLVPSPRYLVPVDGLDPVRAAPLADAALTPYHAVKAALPLLRPGAEAVVIGAGGLGHVAVQLLAGLTPARVVAVDRRETALGLAREAGAHATVDTTAAAAADIRAELGRRGASLVLDFVGVDETLQLGASLLEEGGRLTIVGVGGGELPVSAYESPPMGSTVSTPNWGSLPELLEVVELARAGLVDVHVEPVGLEDALDCYRRLRAGDVIGRAVVTANGG